MDTVHATLQEATRALERIDRMIGALAGRTPARRGRPRKLAATPAAPRPARRRKAKKTTSAAAAARKREYMRRYMRERRARAGAAVATRKKK